MWGSLYKVLVEEVSVWMMDLGCGCYIEVGKLFSNNWLFRELLSSWFIYIFVWGCGFGIDSNLVREVRYGYGENFGNEVR